MTDRPLKYVGKALPRADARDKLTGRALYTADLLIPGMLTARLLRSTAPHAVLKDVDVAAARAIPGVLVVLTAADLPALVAESDFGPVLKDCPLLAVDRVRYEGEPIALVVAEDDLAAEEALEAIRVSYEDLPVIGGIDEAIAPGAYALHSVLKPAGHMAEATAKPEAERNICHQYHHKRGDVDAAFATAAHVFEHTYTTPMMYHYTLENHAAIAVPEGNGLVIHTGTQYPFLVRRMVADVLGWDLNRVRIHVPAIGGAFGSKEYMNVVPLAAVAALAVGRPVKLELSLEEAFRSFARHGSQIRIKSGVAADGRLLAREVELYLDTGAYADNGPRVLRQAAYRSPGPYRLPNLKVDAYCMYTNKVPAGAYRGFGATQSTWAFECHMDEIAHALGLDPLEFRLRNLLNRGEDFEAGDTPVDGDIIRVMRVAAEAVGWAQDRPAPGRAIGAAVAIKNTASGPLVSQAMVRLHADGSATLLCGTVEMGQGSMTIMRQIVAEELDIPPERIRVQDPDTETTPYDQRTSSSRSTVQMGLAVQRAARSVLRQLRETAALDHGHPPESFELAEGGLTAPDGALLTYPQLISSFTGAFGSEVIGLGMFKPDRAKAPPPVNSQITGFWEISAGMADIAVDMATGEIRIQRYITASDAGRCINPGTAHGQEEGGAVMAIGHALFEANHYEQGYFRNPNLVDYRVPAFHDLPATLEAITIEEADGPGPYGSKGLGESSILTVAPSVANALFRATGIRLRDLPLTPEAVWRQLRNRS